MVDLGNTILETRNLSKFFSGMRAVRAVSMHFRRQQLTSIIGPNGAGKSTLFKMITGLYAPSAGDIFFKGINITGWPPHRITKSGIGQSFQIINIFSRLSVLENVRLAAQSRGSMNFKFLRLASSYKNIEKEAMKVVEDVELGDKMNEIAANLSHGEKRKLELGIVLARDPECILLDEPTSGMASEEISDIVNLIQEVAQRKTVIMVEHNMDVVLSISSRILVMHRGEIIADGPPGEIRTDENIQRIYLGEL